MNNILVVSIYDGGWGGFVDACVICDNKRVDLEQHYVKSLSLCSTEELIEKAKELNFNGIIICEDGTIVTEFFD